MRNFFMWEEYYRLEYKEEIFNLTFYNRKI